MTTWTYYNKFARLFVKNFYKGDKLVKTIMSNPDCFDHDNVYNYDECDE